MAFLLGENKCRVKCYFTESYVEFGFDENTSFELSGCKVLNVWILLQ